MKKFTAKAAICILTVFLLCINVYAAEKLVAGGEVIGLELSNQTLCVAAFDDVLGAQSRASGLRIGDRITKIDGTAVQSVQDVKNALAQADGTVELTLLRDGKTRRLRLTPQETKDGPRLGVYLKNGVTGIGTVTWYDPQSGVFGALGHGVSDAGGDLLPMKKGFAFSAEVRAVKKGKSGEPGQLVGALYGTDPIALLHKNTEHGIFGTTAVGFAGTPMDVGASSAVHPGAATIRSTILGQQVREYSVEILKVYPNSGSRNMLLRVTDPALLDATGGIVQGMSGSPVIQDGKLVGAVTHVLINDPTTGYGIFVENMLETAQISGSLKEAS